LIGLQLSAQQISLIPYPSNVVVKNESGFELTRNTRIILGNEQLQNEAEYLQGMFRKSIGVELPIVFEKNELRGGGIRLELSSSPLKSDESYMLESDNTGIIIKGATSGGVFYGIQTLLQLLPTEVYGLEMGGSISDWVVPALHIEDEPVFEWRGMHLDVARHFRSVEFVKKFIDQLAFHKFNIFHWHLTEDQGWRIEIKKYPKLTEIGAWRDSTLVGHMRDKPRKFKIGRTGGFYTQEEIKAIVKYAKDRHVTIVPEIEMPGHAQAAVAAYPALGNLGTSPGIRPMWGISEEIFNPEEKTIDFLKDVLDEVMELFPGEYIHIGGDEARKNQWEASERAQELLKERGLTDMHEMQSWFIQQIDNYLTANNRKLIGWDEILEGGLADGAAVMSWRGETGGIKAAKTGHKAVMATNKYTYFDKYQSKDKTKEPLAIGGYVPLELVFAFQPIPTELTEFEAKNIIGAQAQLWSEYIVEDFQMEYMMYPRMCALAEVVWSNKKERDYQFFLKNLEIHLERLDNLDINYRMPEELMQK